MRTDLTCENLTLAYGGEPIIKDLTYRFLRGQVYVITGKNGSGKTTLCRALAGSLMPTGGKVQPALNVDVWSDHWGVAAVMPEDLGVYSSLSPTVIIRHIARGRAYRNLSGVNTADMLLQQIERLFGGQVRDTAFGKLSGGQQRFVSLLVSTINAPAVLIVDEPFTGLDAAAFKVAVDVLDTHASANGIVVLTHNGGITRLPECWTILELGEHDGRHALAAGGRVPEERSVRTFPEVRSSG